MLTPRVVTQARAQAVSDAGLRWWPRAIVTAAISALALSNTPSAGQMQPAVSADSRLNASACASADAPKWCSGGDLGSWINAAYGSGVAVVEVSGPGTISTAVLVPGNGTLRLGPNTYTIKAPIRLGNNAVLVGDGQSTAILNVVAAIPEVVATASSGGTGGLTIANLRISSNGKATNGLVVGNPRSSSYSLRISNVESNDAINANVLLYNPVASFFTNITAGGGGVGPGKTYTHTCLDVETKDVTLGSGNNAFTGLLLYDCDIDLYQYQGSDNMYTNSYAYLQNDLAATAIVKLQDTFNNTIRDWRLEGLVPGQTADILITQSGGAFITSSDNVIVEDSFMGSGQAHPAVQVGEKTGAFVYKTRVEGNRFLARTPSHFDVALVHASNSRVSNNTETSMYGGEQLAFATVDTSGDSTPYVVNYDGSFRSGSFGILSASGKYTAIGTSIGSGYSQFLYHDPGAVCDWSAGASNGHFSWYCAGEKASLDENGNLVAKGSIHANGVQSGKAQWTSGDGPPRGACSSGSLYTNTAGETNTTLYVCERGVWAAK